MSAFSDVGNVDDKVVPIKDYGKINMGGLYNINESVYSCIYIGSEKYSYPGYVPESDLQTVNEMEQQDIPRYDFVRLGTSTDKARFLSIKEQDLSDYTIKEYSLSDACTISGGKKKSKKSKKSRRSNKSRKTRRT